jgi:hypothetical protein
MTQNSQGGIMGLYIKNMGLPIEGACAKILISSEGKVFPASSTICVAEAVEIDDSEIRSKETGHWITPTVIGGKAYSIPHCSICEGVPCGVDKNTRFCPNCGSRMEKE